MTPTKEELEKEVYLKKDEHNRICSQNRAERVVASRWLLGIILTIIVAVSSWGGSLYGRLEATTRSNELSIKSLSDKVQTDRDDITKLEMKYEETQRDISTIKIGIAEIKQILNGK